MFLYNDTSLESRTVFIEIFVQWLNRLLFVPEISFYKHTIKLAFDVYFAEKTLI